MKAIICTKYRSPDVLRPTEVEKPVPRENEILIRIRSVAVATEDPMNRRGEPFFARVFTGLTKPRNPILGAEFAGEIESTGSSVEGFKQSEQVFGSTGIAYGCYAEYVCGPEDGFLAVKPDNIAYEEAAPVCGALAAWNFLVDKAGVQSGQKVLINGASGNVGTAAVQIAKYFRAEITGVCSTPNLDFVRALGAENIIDYTKTDFTKTGQAYDIIFDVSGKSSFSGCKRSLTPNGIYLSTVPGLGIVFHMFWTSLTGGKNAIFSATGLRPVSLRLGFLKELIQIIEAGKLKTFIDSRYSLGQVADAHRRVESGHKRGNVVINLDSIDNS